MFYTSNAETLLVSHRAMNTIWLESVHIARNSRKTSLAKRICRWAHEGPAARPSHVSGSGTHGAQWPGSDTSLLKASLGNMEVSLRIHTELALRKRLQIASATQWPPEFCGKRSIGSLCLCLKFWFLKASYCLCLNWCSWLFGFVACSRVDCFRVVPMYKYRICSW